MCAAAGTFNPFVGVSSEAGCTQCPMGQWCARGTAYPQPCAAGRVGDMPGQTSPMCTGVCAVGHYCVEGSTSTTAGVCAAGTFNPNNGVESEAGCETCPIGQWCARGTGLPYLCAAGRFGDSAGLTSRECTGACAVGHYCEEGSTSNTSSSCREATSPNALEPAPLLHAGALRRLAAIASRLRQLLAPLVVQLPARTTPSSAARAQQHACRARLAAIPRLARQLVACATSSTTAHSRILPQPSARCAKASRSSASLAAWMLQPRRSTSHGSTGDILHRQL